MKMEAGNIWIVFNGYRIPSFLEEAIIPCYAHILSVAYGAFDNQIFYIHYHNLYSLWLFIFIITIYSHYYNLYSLVQFTFIIIIYIYYYNLYWLLQFHCSFISYCVIDVCCCWSKAIRRTLMLLCVLVHIKVWMYAAMCACTYIGMNVCYYVCLYIYRSECMQLCVLVHIKVWMYAAMCACTYKGVNVCSYVCLYI